MKKREQAIKNEYENDKYQSEVIQQGFTWIILHETFKCNHDKRRNKREQFVMKAECKYDSYALKLKIILLRNRKNFGWED